LGNVVSKMLGMNQVKVCFSFVVVVIRRCSWFDLVFATYYSKPNR